MPNVLITGGNGVLGSALSKLFLEMGNRVTVIDIVRKEECWRLEQLGIIDQVNYLWKGSQDISKEDLRGIDLVIDCAIGFPDRPFGTSSSTITANANIGPALGLLQAVRWLDKKPLLIYPSSFNALYGNSGTYDESTSTHPTTVYGWTKASVEQLYRTYQVSFDVPTIITRVGSSYGVMMRTDELVAKIILSGLRQKEFYLRSPRSRRLWTYLDDVVRAYRAIAEITCCGEDLSILNSLNQGSLVLNIAGSRGDQILDNMELAHLISDVLGQEINVKQSDVYEPGELVHGKPVDFQFDARLTRNLLDWKPQISLRDGLERTVEWFGQNLRMVRNWS